jgi:hypothetical protein
MAMFDAFRKIFSLFYYIWALRVWHRNWVPTEMGMQSRSTLIGERLYGYGQRARNVEHIATWGGGT